LPAVFERKLSNINLEPLKRFALEKLGRESALRDILLQEKDEVSPAEFLIKLEIWLALLRRQEW